MPVTYTLVERINPQDRTAPKKYYAQAKAAGEINIKKLSQEIAARSTVNSADTLAVLDCLVQMMVVHLAEGRIVRLGDFGSFQIAISSDGTDSATKFSSSLIRGNKIIYRPGSDIKEMLAGVTYKKEAKS